jgi:beta-galactosidase
MKSFVFFLILYIASSHLAGAKDPRTVISLNGSWEFDQTLTAFPPKKFTRKIPVPGLIHLAEPKIEEYGKFFRRPDKADSNPTYIGFYSGNEKKLRINTYNIDYTPRYNWYRKVIYIPKELENNEAIITLKKSMYVTQVFFNGIDMGSSIACYTPVEFPVTKAIKFGAENEILIKVSDRYWLPGEAAGGYDNEKEHYLPGIWDDVLLSFTGKIRINRLLVLPSVAQKMVTVKIQIRNLNQAQNFNSPEKTDSVTLDVSIAEKASGKEIAKTTGRFLTKRDNLTELMFEIPMRDFKAWKPEEPFLYEAKVSVKYLDGISDGLNKRFGVRDFTRKGKYFYLNGEKYILRGTNITLHRFFEDPDCGNLVWDKNWVKKLLIDYPKQLDWNAMRICVGIIPDFWYDLADEYGIMFQNEWLYWQTHGWDEQIRREYTDWVWTDGSHPSIIIWDAINENWDDFIGNVLIPDLKKLDPTRIWDAGYMTGDHMALDEMDEPHPYQRPSVPFERFDKNPYPLGKLDFKPNVLAQSSQSGAAQLVNEYGWVWLWRNGQPAKLTVDVYKYYLGENSTPEQNWQFQAYWSQLETEWLRSQSFYAGVLAFCYLTNNYGYTGDWFTGNIKDLKPSHTLNWFVDAFAATAVFINLTDERYVKNTPPHKPGSNLVFNLVKVNDTGKQVSGTLSLSICDNSGKVAVKQAIPVNLAAYDRSFLPAEITIPEKPGGYLLVAEFIAKDGSKPVISRRFIKVGEVSEYAYFEMEKETLK